MRTVMAAALVAVACEAAPEPPVAEASSPAPQSPDTAETVDVQVRPFLDAYDFEDRIWYHDLPGRLEEVSGLAFTPDGRLFAHDDERARIHEIDPSNAEVGKRFDLGEELVRGDFEGIVVVGERFFVVTSTGLLYEFREGEDRENVTFRVTDVGMRDTCEIEGLDYDPGDDALLFACKTALPDRDAVVVHRLPIDPEAPRLPDLLLPRDALRAVGVDPTFAPSGIAVTPDGSFLLLSGRDDALIEVDRDGRLIAAVQLRSGRHPQSEGIAIGPDGTLYISDEKNGKEARLTAYGPRTDGQGS